ncbi:SRPBCC family protein [Leptospira sp. 'Mane']|uniref:SRPBCC family protein n=1 Tax=Leptospira sp. 'Mane' TaxID=3387407 RepID=UPI00398A8D48
MISINELYTSIEINAPVETVWEEFMNFSEYPKWNPFLPKVNVDLTTGKVWEKVFLGNLFGKRRYSWLPMQILNFDQQREISWCGRVPWIIAIWSYGYHIFYFEKIGPNLTRFSHRGVFSGIFMTLSLSISKIKNNVKIVQEEMNKNLKERCERRP